MRSLSIHVFAIGLALVVTSSAQAALIEIDLAGGNLNEVTRDDGTGLDWLDLTETVGLTPTDAIALANGAFGGGWRLATGEELCLLLQTHGLDPACSGTPPSGNVTNFSPPNDENDLLLALLGVTLTTTPNLQAAIAFYDDGDANPLVGNVDFRRYDAAPSTQSFIAPNFWSVPAGVGAARGSALVRSVPEPSFGVLVLTGIAYITRRQAVRGQDS